VPAETIAGRTGVWVPRESLPNGLDHAASLDHIRWKDSRGKWHLGITSERVQYEVFVEVDMIAEASRGNQG
jgi:hypothetical protein